MALLTKIPLIIASGCVLLVSLVPSLYMIRQIFNLMFSKGVASSTMSSTSLENNLLLYSHHHSYYSRKVLLTLGEKNVPYKVQTIDIMKDEQYQPWFMEINPKGEIPVLKDGSAIIIDSKHIINYLDDGFIRGDYVSLIPKDVESKVRFRISELRNAVDAIEGNRLLFGLCTYPEYVDADDKHYPYNIPGVCGAMADSVNKMPEKLRALAEKYPQHRETMLEKAVRAEQTKKIVQNKEAFHKDIEAVDSLFAMLNQELESHPDDWLTGERYTQADVSLTVLMDRIWRAGGASKMWGKYPNLQSYFARVQHRPAYRAIDVSFRDDLGMFGPYLAGFAALILLVVGGLCSIPVWIRKYRNSK